MKINYRFILVISIVFLCACRSSGPHNKVREAKVKPSTISIREQKKVNRQVSRSIKRDIRNKKREKRHSGYYN